MTQEEELVYTIKGVIASMNKEDQEKVQTAYDRIKVILDQTSYHGLTALALLGAEQQQYAK
jgi:hypothetical protein